MRISYSDVTTLHASLKSWNFFIKHCAYDDGDGQNVEKKAQICKEMLKPCGPCTRMQSNLESFIVIFFYRSRCRVTEHKLAIIDIIAMLSGGWIVSMESNSPLIPVLDIFVQFLWPVFSILLISCLQFKPLADAWIIFLWSPVKPSNLLNRIMPLTPMFELFVSIAVNILHLPWSARMLAHCGLA